MTNLPDPVSRTASSLKDLLSSTEYSDWDAKYNVTSDLESLVESLLVRRDILERARMGRLNYSWYIQENVERFPDRIAMIFEGRSWTWKQFSDIVDSMAIWWASIGIRYKDPCAIIMTNSSDFVFTWLGLIKAGGVPCFIDFNLKGIALRHVLSIAPMRAVIVENHLANNVKEILADFKEQPIVHAYGNLNESSPFPLVHAESLPRPLHPVPGPPAEPEDLGLLLYTSGTTGLPKGFHTSYSKKQASCLTFSRRYKINQHDRILVTTPLYHGTAAFLGVGASLVTGAATIILKKFSATTFWKTARETGATQCIYVGEIPRYLMNQPPSPNDQNHSIRTFGGLGMRKDIWIPFKKRFGIKNVYEYWGQTEAQTSLRNLQETAADGTEPWAGYIATLGPIAREAFRVKLVYHDHNTQEPYRNAQGHFEEVKPGEPGNFLIQVDATRPSGQYYNNLEATKKKIAVDPFGPNTGSWYVSGDLLKYDEHNGWNFVDRTGDTFRWKGENVATGSVEMVLMSYPGIRMANVYGVKVPFQEDGRAGMAIITVDPNVFNLEGLAAYLSKHIARYARPLWLRVRTGEDINASGLFKLIKVELVKAAMDPEKADAQDKLYFLDETSGSNLEKHVYKPWSSQDYADLLSGKTGPGGHKVYAKL